MPEPRTFAEHISSLTNARIRRAGAVVRFVGAWWPWVGCSGRGSCVCGIGAVPASTDAWAVVMSKVDGDGSLRMADTSDHTNEKDI